MMAKVDFPVCEDERKCFARKEGKCSILREIPEQPCRFCKPKRNVTNGKTYPDYTIGGGEATRKVIHSKPKQEEGE